MTFCCQAKSVTRCASGSEVSKQCPAFVLEFEMLGDDHVRAGVQIRQGLKLRDPSAENFVGHRQLPEVVVSLDDHVPAEVRQRAF